MFKYKEPHHIQEGHNCVPSNWRVEYPIKNTSEQLRHICCPRALYRYGKHLPLTCWYPQIRHMNVQSVSITATHEGVMCSSLNLRLADSKEETRSWVLWKAPISILSILFAVQVRGASFEHTKHKWFLISYFLMSLENMPRNRKFI